MEGRKQFTFYRSFWEAVSGLPKKDQLPVLCAIILYGLDGTIPEGLSKTQNAFFLLVKPTLDASRKKAEIGKQGGSKPKAKRKQTEREKENEKENEIEIEIEKENEIEKEIENAPVIQSESNLNPDTNAVPTRHQYGSYGNVLLTDAELDKLMEEFPDWGARIERLSGYMASTGRKYENHLATIRNWASRDRDTRRPETGGSFLELVGVEHDGV